MSATVMGLMIGTVVAVTVTAQRSIFTQLPVPFSFPWNVRNPQCQGLPQNFISMPENLGCARACVLACRCVCVRAARACACTFPETTSDRARAFADILLGGWCVLCISHRRVICTSHADGLQVQHRRFDAISHLMLSCWEFLFVYTASPLCQWYGASVRHGGFEARRQLNV